MVLLSGNSLQFLRGRFIALTRSALTRTALTLTAVTAAALVGAASLSGCAVTFPVPTPPAPAATLINGGNDGVLIPLHVERADEGHARPGLPVQLDGKPVYMAFDTGTQGVRVLSKVLPGTNYPVTGAATSLTFANGAQVSGPSVKLPVSVAGTQPVEVTPRKPSTTCAASATRESVLQWTATPASSAGRSPACSARVPANRTTTAARNRCVPCRAISASAIWCTPTSPSLS
jgi:hypothetical protein